MFKIWAKTIKNDKVQKSLMYKGEDKYDTELFSKYLVEICEQLDIPTPVVLKSHTRNFDTFNVTRFLPSDFVEQVNFDAFTIEYCRDDHTQKKYIYKAYLPVD